MPMLLVFLLLVLLLLLAVVMNYYSEITLTAPFRVVDGVECPFCMLHSTSLLCGKITVCCTEKKVQ